MAKDVTDGKYAGTMTADEVIEQFEYRAGIHLSYIKLINEQPNAGWEVYGTEEWHLWAINGYEKGIRRIRENNPVEYRCNVNEALNTLIRAFVDTFKKNKRGLLLWLIATMRKNQEADHENTLQSRSLINSSITTSCI